MIRTPRTHRWTNLDHTAGLLLFAQRVEEMLFDYTLDTYKVPALNTFTRCLELLKTVEDVKSGLIRDKTLSPIVEELSHSVAEDTAARAVARPHAADFGRFEWWQLHQTSRLQVQAELLRGYLWKRAYERELVRQLRIEVESGHRKQAINDLAANLVVEWTRIGFSRDFIFMRTRTFFFGFGQPIVDAAETFDQYIALFEPKKRKFDVCLRAHASLGELARAIPPELASITVEAPAPRAGLAREKKFLTRAHSGVYVVLPDREAHDARSARDQGFRILNNLSTVASFHVHRTPFAVDREALVWNDNHPVVLRAPTLAIHKHDECGLSDLLPRFDRTLGAFSPSHSGEDAWMRLRAGLGLHASAVGSEDVAVQLTTLWSALEAIVPSPLDESRIQTLSDVLGPVLCLGYARKIFQDAHESLLRCAKVQYLQSVERVGYDTPSYHACAAIIAIEANEPARDLIYEACDRNPLLRFRIYRLKRAFESADTTLATIRAHERRVLWHLRRLYRTRNMIVHAGRTPQLRETLVENVHYYFHHVVNALESLYAAEPKPATLDAAFLSLRMQHERHTWFLRAQQDAACTSPTLEAVLFGSNLPN